MECLVPLVISMMLFMRQEPLLRRKKCVDLWKFFPGAGNLFLHLISDHTSGCIIIQNVHAACGHFGCLVSVWLKVQFSFILVGCWWFLRDSGSWFSSLVCKMLLASYKTLSARKFCESIEFLCIYGFLRKMPLASSSKQTLNLSLSELTLCEFQESQFPYSCFRITVQCSTLRPTLLHKILA